VSSSPPEANAAQRPPDGPVLAFDAASPVASAALALSGRLVTCRALAEERSSGVLLGLIDGVLGEAGVRPAELSGAVALGGPGSFTGTRVALATALGLRLAGVPRATAISSLEALALAAPDDLRRPLAVVDALRGDWFVQFFDRDGAADPRPGSEPLLVPASAPLPADVDGLVGFGADRLAAHHPGVRVVLPDSLAPAVAIAASLGRWLWDETALGRPQYLRPPAVRRPP
jgi:tRNA threonylcarbamoyladenosine biosynthesis protein TsaB